MIETSGPSAIRPGFSNYAAASQRVFRLALTCLSQPCQVMKLERDLPPFDAPLPPVPASLALTLLDPATPVWLSPAWGQGAGWLRFHRGCPILDQPQKAAFILAASPAELPPLISLKQGVDRYPDTSATVILGSVLPLDDRNPLTAKGPGIDGSLVFKGHGLDRDFLSQWRDNREFYPLGVDVFLTGGLALAGLPRSVGLDDNRTQEARSCM